MTSIPNANATTGLLVAHRGGGEIVGVCGCGAELGPAGRVVLPADGHGPTRAHCGPCLSADAEVMATIAERGITFVEAFPLALTAHGCQPRFVESEVAA